MSESTLLTIYIMAQNFASPIFHKLGLDIRGVNGLMGMAIAASVGLGAGIAALGGISIKMASTFQQQMARIKGLTGASADEVDYYQKKILALSPTWDLTATDAAKALYFIISAGFKGAQAIDILNYSAKSATASLADQATVADALTSMMNAYKDANIGAAEAANDLTKIEIYGKAQLQSFASSLGFTMVTAHAAGISIAEASAAVATLSQVSGSHGIRRISMEFDNLARSMLDINAIAKRAKAQGLNFDTAAFATMTFIQKLQYLQHITGALSSNINDETYSMMKNMDATKNQLAATAQLDLHLDKANSSFMKLTGGAAAFIPAAILVSDKASEFNMILDRMHDQTDMVTNAFNTMRGTVTQQLKMLEIRFQNIGIAIGLHLLPYVTMFLKALMATLEPVTQFVGTADGITTLKYAFLGLAIVIGGPLTAAIWGLLAPALPFIATMAAIVTISILVGKVLQQHPEILRAVQVGWQNFWSATQPILHMLQTVVASVGAAFQRAFQDPALQTALQNIWTALQPLVPVLQQVGTVIVGVVLLSLIALGASLIFLANILPGLVELWSGWLTILIGVGRVLLDLVTLNYKDIPAAFKQVSQGMQETAQGWTDFANGAANGWKASTKFTQDALTQLKQLGIQQQTDHAKTLQAMTARQAKADAARLQQQIAAEQRHINALQVAANKETDIRKRAQLETQIAKLKFDQQGQQDQIAADQALAGLLNTHFQQVQQITTQHSTVQQTHRQQAMQRDAEGLNQHHQQVVAALTQHYAHLAAKQVGADAAALAEARQHYALLHGIAQWFYNLMHPTHAKAITQHKTQTDAAHKALEAAAKAHAARSAAQAGQAATKIVTQHATQLQQGKTVTDHAAQVGITHPVQSQMLTLHTSLKDSGKNLVAMIAADITASAPKMGQAAKGAFDQIKGWLGFGSPPPNAPEAALWGSNAMQLVADSLRSGYTLLAAASQAGYDIMAGHFTQPIAAGVGGGAGSLAGQTPLVGGGTHNSTIHIHFPNATKANEIDHAVTQIIERHGRSMNTRNRRGGFGGGFNTGAF